MCIHTLILHLLHTNAMLKIIIIVMHATVHVAN